MVIKILTQGAEKILEIERIEEIRDQNGMFILKGWDKHNLEMTLANYREPIRSNNVMLYICDRYNKNNSEIIRLPEDDEDVEKLI